MSKGKRPRKRTDPDPIRNDESKEPEQTETRGELVPQRQPPPQVRRGSEALLVEFVQTLRNAVGAILDIADAAAEALKKRLERPQS